MLKLNMVWIQIKSSFAFSTRFKTIHFLFLRSFGGSLLATSLALSVWPDPWIPPSHTSGELDSFSHKDFFPTALLPLKCSLIGAKYFEQSLAGGHVKYVLLSCRRGNGWALKQMYIQMETPCEGRDTLLPLMNVLWGLFSSTCCFAAGKKATSFCVWHNEREGGNQENRFLHHSSGQS